MTKTIDAELIPGLGKNRTTESTDPSCSYVKYANGNSNQARDQSVDEPIKSFDR